MMKHTCGPKFNWRFILLRCRAGLPGYLIGRDELRPRMTAGVSSWLAPNIRTRDSLKTCKLSRNCVEMTVGVSGCLAGGCGGAGVRELARPACHWMAPRVPATAPGLASQREASSNLAARAVRSLTREIVSPPHTYLDNVFWRWSKLSHFCPVQAFQGGSRSPT
jgi:hypothetical protein